MVTERILLVGPDWASNGDVPSQLYGLTEDWEFVTSHNGLAALNHMAQQPFDAVIADLGLPGMDGGVFLDLALKRHPQVLRFLHVPLGLDHARFNCVGTTHQLLSKPSSPKTIHKILKRAFSFKTWLPGPAVHPLMSSLGKLPSTPELYFQVVREIQSNDSSCESVGRLIARDPVMTAKVLQLANSVAYGRQQHVSGPVDAVVYLGMETTKSLLLLAHTFSYFDSFKLSDFHPEQLWRHSLSVARLAQRITQLEGMPDEMAGQAYTAGLLHDLGKLVLAVNLPELFTRAIRVATSSQTPFWQVENDLFGANHADIGAALLGIWGLPADILEAVARHHFPSRFLHNEFCPLTAVHAANILAQENITGNPFVAPMMDINYLASLNLSSTVEKWRKQTLRDESAAKRYL